MKKDEQKRSTLDNRNTFSQIEYLADVYTLTKKQKYRAASEKGLQYLLSTQKNNGGWRGWDVDAVTFNDDVTTGTLELFRNILQGDSSFLWLDSDMLKAIQKSYDKGLAVVLNEILDNSAIHEPISIKFETQILFGMPS